MSCVLYNYVLLLFVCTVIQLFEITYSLDNDQDYDIFIDKTTYDNNQPRCYMVLPGKNITVRFKRFANNRNLECYDDTYGCIQKMTENASDYLSINLPKLIEDVVVLYTCSIHQYDDEINFEIQFRLRAPRVQILGLPQKNIVKQYQSDGNLFYTVYRYAVGETLHLACMTWFPLKQRRRNHDKDILSWNKDKTASTFFDGITSWKIVKSAFKNVKKTLEEFISTDYTEFLSSSDQDEDLEMYFLNTTITLTASHDNFKLECLKKYSDARAIVVLEKGTYPINTITPPGNLNNITDPALVDSSTNNTVPLLLIIGFLCFLVITLVICFACWMGKTKKTTMPQNEFTNVLTTSCNPNYVFSYQRESPTIDDCYMVDNPSYLKSESTTNYRLNSGNNARGSKKAGCNKFNVEKTENHYEYIKEDDLKTDNSLKHHGDYDYAYQHASFKVKPRSSRSSKIEYTKNIPKDNITKIRKDDKIIDDAKRNNSYGHNQPRTTNHYNNITIKEKNKNGLKQRSNECILFENQDYVTVNKNSTDFGNRGDILDLNFNDDATKIDHYENLFDNKYENCNVKH